MVSSLLFFLFLITCPMIGQSQSTLQQNLSSKQPKFSGIASFGYNSNLYKQGSVDNESDVSADLTMTYKIKDANLLRAFVSGFRENTQDQETKLNDGFIGWINNTFWRKSEILTIGQQLRLNLPYSKDSRVRDSKVFGVSLVPVFIVNMAPLGIADLSLIYQPQFIKNSHTYKTNGEGKSNTSYAITHTIFASYSFLEKFYIQPALQYSNSWTYSNRKKRDAFKSMFELGYSIGKSIIIASGWTNEGSIRNFEYGNDQTIEVFNNRTSIVYGALYYMF